MDSSPSIMRVAEYDELVVNATLGLISGSAKTECGHPQLKGFTFSDGQTIHMCPDCTKFDENRRAVLAGTKRKVDGKNCVTTFSEKSVLALYGGSND